jgi:hypothetical protein
MVGLKKKILLSGRTIYTTLPYKGRTTFSANSRIGFISNNLINVDGKKYRIIRYPTIL